MSLLYQAPKLFPPMAAVRKPMILALLWHTHFPNLYLFSLIRMPRVTAVNFIFLSGDIYVLIAVCCTGKITNTCLYLPLMLPTYYFNSAPNAHQITPPCLFFLHKLHISVDPSQSFNTNIITEFLVHVDV